MAVTMTYSNNFKYSLAMKLIDLSTDTVKVLLMASGFSFDKDTHEVLASISASELATGNGYTQQTKTTGTITVSKNLSTDKMDATFPSVQWIASGGAIGPTPGAIFIDTTANVVIGYLNFETERIAYDTTPFVIQDGNFRIG